MRLWKRNPNCWWCHGSGRWTPTSNDNFMGWTETLDEIECSECDGTGLATWRRNEQQDEVEVS